MVRITPSCASRHASLERQWRPKKAVTHFKEIHMQLKTAPLAVALAGSLLTAPAMAEGLLHWHSNSLTYLYGKDYKIDAPIQQTVTFEHVNGWKYGDTFLFLDSIHFNGKGNDNGNDDSTFYGEFSPRLSFGKIFQRDLSFGPIKDVLVAMTYEFGEGDVETYMIGPGFDLDVPGFDYVSVNVYHRDTDGDRVGDGTWQVTPVWGYTLPVGNSDILIDGFIDWVVDNDSNSRGEEYHANLHINPQIKYDLGKAMNWGEKQLYVGIEYDYWSDKYGIENGGFVSENFVGKTDQNTFSAIVKAHF